MTRTAAVTAWSRLDAVVSVSGSARRSDARVCSAAIGPTSSSAEIASDAESPARTISAVAGAHRVGAGARQRGGALGIELRGRESGAEVDGTERQVGVVDDRRERLLGAPHDRDAPLSFGEAHGPTGRTDPAGCARVRDVDSPRREHIFEQGTEIAVIVRCDGADLDRAAAYPSEARLYELDPRERPRDRAHGDERDDNGPVVAELGVGAGSAGEEHERS